MPSEQDSRVDQTHPSEGEMLAHLFGHLLGLGMLVIAALSAARIISGSSMSVGEGAFKLIATLGLLALIVFGTIFLIGMVLWATVKITDALIAHLKRLIWGETDE